MPFLSVVVLFFFLFFFPGVCFVFDVVVAVVVLLIFNCIFSSFLKASKIEFLIMNIPYCYT